MTPQGDDAECCVFDIQIHSKHQTFDNRLNDEISTMNLQSQVQFSEDNSYLNSQITSALMSPLVSDHISNQPYVVPSGGTQTSNHTVAQNNGGPTINNVKLIQNQKNNPKRLANSITKSAKKGGKHRRQSSSQQETVDLEPTKKNSFRYERDLEEIETPIKEN